MGPNVSAEEAGEYAEGRERKRRMAPDVSAEGFSNTDEGVRSPPLFRSKALERLSLETAFSLLAAPRRRYVCYCLMEADEDTVPFEYLRDRVFAWERSRNATEDLSSVATSLRHCHLPKLADADLLEWDQEADLVEYHRDPLLERWLRETRHVDFEPSLQG